MNRIKIPREWVLLGSLALFKLVLHFATNTNYDLHRDAFLYLAQADHLDFGFMSVPPGTALLAWLSGHLFGDSIFAVRLLPALVGAASVVIIGLLVKNLGGQLWAIALAGTAFIFSPAFLRSNTLFQPVSFNQFFWLLTAYFAVKLLKSQNPKYWIHLAITWGLAFLNKYAIAFLAAAFLLSLLFTPQRRLLKSRYFLYGLLLGFAIILPNLIWQHFHGWPVVWHLRELQATQLVNVRISDFLLMQVLMNLPALPIWVFGLIFLLFAKTMTSYRALGYTFIAVIVLLLALRGKPYYTLGIYSLLFAAGGVAIEHYFSQRRRFMRPVLLTTTVLISLPVLPYSLPLLAMDKMVAYVEASKGYGLESLLRWEDGRLHTLPQDYADMIGWKALADIVADAYNQLSEAEKAKCAIYAENYGQAGAIKYYGKSAALPEPVSFHGSFLYWAPENIAGFETLIYVNHGLSEDILSGFENIREIGRLTEPNAREFGVRVYICRNPRPEFIDFYREKVNSLRQEF